MLLESTFRVHSVPNCEASMRITTWRRVRVMMTAASTILTLAAACSTSSQPAGVPPAIPTHHALVAGSVASATGASVTGAEIGTRFSERSHVSLQASVIGGAVVGPAGDYELEVKTTAPKAVDGSIEFYVVLGQVFANGSRVLRDSAQVRVRVVPMAQQPPKVTVRTMMLP